MKILFRGSRHILTHTHSCATAICGLANVLLSDKRKWHHAVTLSRSHANCLSDTHVEIITRYNRTIAMAAAITITWMRLLCYVYELHLRIEYSVQTAKYTMCIRNAIYTFVCRMVWEMTPATCLSRRVQLLNAKNPITLENQLQVAKRFSKRIILVDY